MRRNSRATNLSLLTLLAIGAGVLCATGPVLAYTEYSIDDDATNCRFCHGDFRSNSYFGSDGQNWGNLHNLHRFDMLSGDCDTCHIGDDFLPVPIGESNGGDGLAPIGCVGCHGRAEDGAGSGTEGLGLQVHHNLLVPGGDQNGLRCITCHPAAGTTTPVGEDVLPVYYANPGNGHPNMPTDPCNPAPGLPEDFAGSAEGLDNDGDDAYDELDPDCSAQALTPGETSARDLPMMLVESIDPGTREIEISYSVACETTNHNVEYGALEDVALYDYTGQACSIGPTSPSTWIYPEDPANLYFVVVGTNSEAEGSYGLDSDLNERPDDTVNMTCPLPQNLDDRCD